MPRLTEYLLKLATDAEELQKYRALRERAEKGAAAATDYLTTQPWPALTQEQAQIVLGHDSRQVVEAVQKELAAESSRPEQPFYGIPITFVCEVNGDIQTRFSQ